MNMRISSLLLVAALLATACGARLTEEQRNLAIAGAGGNEGVVAAPSESAAPGTVTPTTPSTASTAPSGDGPEVAGPGPDTSGPAVAATGADNPDPGTDPGPDPGGDGDPAPQATPTAAPTESGGGGEVVDTRAAPPGGNGGATDIGVTEDTIVLGNVSDVSGPVPGIFEPSQLAVKAYIAYFTASEGTIYGRQLEYLPKDGRLDAGANRAASIEVCENAFMAVGSMSANDQGAAQPIEECGIPDVRAASTNNPMKAVPNAFPTNVTNEGVEPMSQYKWFADNYPESITKAAFLFICGEVTEQSTLQLREAQIAELDYDYVYVQCIEIQETNYAAFVANMKDRGVDYVAFQGAYQQAARLAQAMAQQDFDPSVYVLQSNAYNQNTVQLGGADMEGDFAITSSAVIEEIEQTPELQLYAQWLEQVAPGERPTGLGMYSWSAAKLSVELLKQAGPELTRAKILELLPGVEEWTGGGLHGAQDVGPKRLPSDCFNILQIQGGAFVKVEPAGAQQLTCGNFFYDVR